MELHKPSTATTTLVFFMTTPKVTRGCSFVRRIDNFNATLQSLSTLDRPFHFLNHGSTICCLDHRPLQTVALLASWLAQVLLSEIRLNPYLCCTHLSWFILQLHIFRNPRGGLDIRNVTWFIHPVAVQAQGKGVSLFKCS